jgi:hypothetical protein
MGGGGDEEKRENGRRENIVSLVGVMRARGVISDCSTYSVFV